MAIKKYIFYAYAKLFARNNFRFFNNFLVDLGMRGLGIQNYLDLDISGESHFIKYLKKNYDLKIIFDVGANNGEYSKLFEQPAKVLAFEPNEHSYSVLKEKTKELDNITIYNFGFGEYEGEVEMFDRMGNDGSQHATIYKDVITEIHKKQASSTKIKLTRIDKFMQENGIDHISLLKIDTEGNEFFILKGAVSALSQNAIDIIHIEFNEMNVISKVFFRDFYYLLLNYNLYRLLPGAFLKLDYSTEKPLKLELFAFQNIIAIRKAIDKNN